MHFFFSVSAHHCGPALISCALIRSDVLAGVRMIPRDGTFLELAAQRLSAGYRALVLLALIAFVFSLPGKGCVCETFSSFRASLYSFGRDFRFCVLGFGVSPALHPIAGISVRVTYFRSRTHSIFALTLIVGV